MGCCSPTYLQHQEHSFFILVLVFVLMNMKLEIEFENQALIIMLHSELEVIFRFC